MRKLGSPFQTDTLSNLILSVLLAVVMVYSYFQAEVQRTVHLFFVVLVIALAIKSYFAYSRSYREGEGRLIEEND